MVVRSGFGSASALVEVTVDMSEVDSFAGWHIMIWLGSGRRRCGRVVR